MLSAQPIEHSPSERGSELCGAVFDVQTLCLYDGPGIRTCVYLRGCPLRCRWCHNPEAYTETLPRAVTSGRSRLRRLSVTELVREALQDVSFFAGSGGGVTFTGGEPTVQSEFLLAALRDLKSRGVHTAVETCGDFPSSLIAPLADYTDLFLYDLKSCDDARHRQATGRGNRRIADNFGLLLDEVGAERMWPRVPVIPGFNDNRGSAADLARFLTASGYRGPVHLMPYHAMARSKYERLGLGSSFAEYPPLGREALDSVRDGLAEAGFETQVFG